MQPHQIIAELGKRSLIERFTEKGDLKSHLQSCRTLYCGFDPTADSLHVGSLIPLITLFRFAACGHRPILLVGGATGLVGDPSFKDAERRQLQPEQIRRCCEAIGVQCEKIFANYRKLYQRHFEEDFAVRELTIMDNIHWYDGVNILDFLRDTGKHFSVNMMIRRDAVKQRLEGQESGLSFTEFSYLLLQAYDFLRLYKDHGCTLQIGGSDQWGNIVGGIDLIRRFDALSDGDEGSSSQVWGLTLPLITNSDGSKFGKTEAGNIWLSAERTSPYRFFQFWVNIADTDLQRYTDYFSPFRNGLATSNDEVDQLRADKFKLAEELTELVHGEEGLMTARRITTALFSGTPELSTEGDLEQLALDGMERTDLSGEEFALVDALVKSGLALTPRGQVTAGQARKLISAGAIHVNGEVIGDVNAQLRRCDALYGRFHMVRRGKKHYHLFFWH